MHLNLFDRSKIPKDLQPVLSKQSVASRQACSNEFESGGASAPRFYQTTVPTPRTRTVNQKINEARNPDLISLKGRINRMNLENMLPVTSHGKRPPPHPATKGCGDAALTRDEMNIE